MSGKYDEAIKQEEAKLSAIQTTLNRLRSSFITAAKEHLKTWYETQTAREVMDNHELTTSLGPDRLRILKSQLQSFKEKTPEFIAEYVDRDEVWPHCQPPKNEHLRLETQGIVEAMGYAAGRLGSVLESYGYLGDDMSPNGGRLGSFTIKDGMLYYPFSLPPSLKDLLTEYNNHAVNLKLAEEAVSKAKRKKAEGEAGDLWNSA